MQCVVFGIIFRLFDIFRTIHLAPEDLGIDGGLGTFGMVDNKENQKIPLKIREGAAVLR